MIMDHHLNKKPLFHSSQEPLLNLNVRKSNHCWRILRSCYKKFKKLIRLRIQTVWLYMFILLLLFILTNHYRTCPMMFKFDPINLESDSAGKPETMSQIDCDQCSNRSVNQLQSGSLLNRRFPQCIIIGVRKAGTRALLEFLSINKHVRKAEAEIHFFDNDDRYQLGLDYYRQSMPYSQIDQITVEKTPAYFVTPAVPARIHSMNSSIRLVLIVRDPVQRLISDFAQLRLNRLQKLRLTQSMHTGHLNTNGDNVPAMDWPNMDYIKSAVDYVQMQSSSTSSSSSSSSPWPVLKSLNKTKRALIPSVLPSFDQLVINAQGEININYKPVRTSMYSLHLHRWLQIFDRKQLHIVDGDRLIQDPYPEMVRLEQFLQLPAQIKREHFVFNAKKNFFCIRQMTESVPKMQNNSDLWPVRCLNSSKGRKHPNVSNQTVQKLRQFYAPYNRHFFQMIGKNFNWSL